MARKKNPEPPTPPAPYVTAPEWLQDTKESIETLRSKTRRLSMQRELFEAGKLKTDEWESLEKDLLEDIDSHAVDACLTLDRAITAADATETIKTDLQEILRDAWSRVRKLSA